jgi:hypothetical protein
VSGAGFEGDLICQKMGKWPSMAPSDYWVKWVLLGCSALCGKSEIDVRIAHTCMPSLKSENAPLPPRPSAFDSLRRVDVLESKVYNNSLSSLVGGVS